ncbi:MAG: hypothetical protein M1393_01490 [Candidatus Thermoplasmatota archaeon]|nr:hypothetical protein [Candidatus Thermoplasmatota archaeon]MDA8143242.1 hypothetical protein [Thermoplasmatales archaeon]
MSQISGKYITLLQNSGKRNKNEKSSVPDQATRDKGLSHRLTVLFSPKYHGIMPLSQHDLSIHSLHSSPLIIKINDESLEFRSPDRIE